MKKLLILLFFLASMNSSAQVIYLGLDDAEPYLSAGADLTITTLDSILVSARTRNIDSWVWRTDGTGTFTDTTDLSTYYTPSFEDEFQDSIVLTLVGYTLSGQDTIYDSRTITVNTSMPPLAKLLAYWRDDYGIEADSTIILRDSTGVETDTLELLSFSSTVSDGYISAKSTTKLVFQNDTVPITCLFPNYNYADTLYFKMEEHTLNADSTENDPYRLTEIAYYSVSTSGEDSIDLDDYFDVPVVAKTGVIWVDTSGGDYALPSLAAVGASAGDTIYIKTGAYSETNTNGIYITKELYIIGIGDVEIDPSGTYALYAYTTDDVTVRGIDFNGESLSNVIRFRGNGDKTLSKSHVAANINAFFCNEDASFTNTINNCYINGLINNNSIGIYNENYFDTKSNGITAYTTKKQSVNYSFLKESPGTGFVNLNANESSVSLKYNIIYANTFVGSENFTTYVYAKGNTFYKTNKNIPLLFNSGNFTAVIDSNVFINTYFDGLSHLIYATNLNTSYIRDNSFVNPYAASSVIFQETNNQDTIYFSNNTFVSDTTFSVYFKNTNVIYENNSLTSSYGCNSSFNSPDSASRYVIIRNNYIDNQNGNYDHISLGNFDGTGSNIATCEVSGNYIIGAAYHGNDYGSHGILNADVRAANIYRNKIIYCDLGIVNKGFGDVFSGGTSYNVLIECDKPLTSKGANRQSYYNNTVYSSSLTANSAISIVENDDDANNYPSDSNSVVNNIFYTNGYNAFIIGDSVDYINSNNNVFYGYQSFADYKGIDITLATWQEEGYDANSYNSNPGFSSVTNLWPIGTSDAIGNGINLGVSFDDGLDIMTDWTDAPPTIVTKQQPTLWDIGAYIVSE